MSGVDTAAYLKRIGYTGPLEPTADTLRRLQEAHLLAVPFENLSILRKEKIVLDDVALFDKIVQRRRGGFCYELNGLFAALLRQLGFDVAMLSAQVVNAAGDIGPEFDHMTLMVTLDECWLADVGFGDSFRQPLLLDERGDQVQGGEAYRIDSAGDRLMLMRREAGAWKPQYRFGLEAHVYAAYAYMCHYHQTSPDSPFTRKPVCSLATRDGRVTLSGMRLIETRGSERHEQEIVDMAEYEQLLRERFGVELIR